MVKFINTIIKLNNPTINIEGVDIHQMNKPILTNVNLKIEKENFYI